MLRDEVGGDHAYDIANACDEAAATLTSMRDALDERAADPWNLTQRRAEWPAVAQDEHQGNWPPPEQP